MPLCVTMHHPLERHINPQQTQKHRTILVYKIMLHSPTHAQIVRNMEWIVRNLQSLWNLNCLSVIDF